MRYHIGPFLPLFYLDKRVQRKLLNLSLAYFLNWSQTGTDFLHQVLVSYEP